MPIIASMDIKTRKLVNSRNFADMINEVTDITQKPHNTTENFIKS